MKMSEGGRVVIPASIRQTLGLHDGDTVTWELKDGKAVLSSRLTQLREAQSIVRRFVPAGISLADELIADRRAENAQDSVDDRINSINPVVGTGQPASSNPSGAP